jgi:predicted nucleic acid-binding protein
VTYLVDTSAWHRAGAPPVLRRWGELLVQNAIVICDQVALEILYSARNSSDYDAITAELEGLRHVEMGATVFRRARDVQQRLAHVGCLHHRSVTIADLLIAAAAEEANLTVLHYDEDFDRIAAITNQPTEWIVPRGTA